MNKHIFVPLLLVSLLTYACASPHTALNVTSQPTPTSTIQQSETQAFVKVIKANVRSRPSNSAKVIGTLSRGSEVSLIVDERVGPWFKVRDKSTAIEGWVHGDLITLKKAEAKRSKDPTTKSGRSYINVDGIRVPSPCSLTSDLPARQPVAAMVPIASVSIARALVLIMVVLRSGSS
jgi:uncharacterized protein YgiM (DUF1202 family)